MLPPEPDDCSALSRVHLQQWWLLPLSQPGPLQAHESPVRTMCFSHNDNYLLAGEDDGKIKYFKPNLEMIKVGALLDMRLMVAVVSQQDQAGLCCWPHLSACPCCKSESVLAQS